MKIRFLGTAAAEGVPALFCTCKMCAYARKVGGREIRSRAGSLVDGVLKLDFGPDSFMQMVNNHLDYMPIQSFLITHSDDDHIDADELVYRRPGFAAIPEGYPPLTVYGNAAVGKKIEHLLWDGLRFQLAEPYTPFDVEGYTVTAMDAVHCLDNSTKQFPCEYRGTTFYRSERALIYLIEKGGKSLLYAHDTDELDPRVFEALKGKKLDLISMDGNNGSWNPEWVGHMSAKKNLKMREQLLQCGAADAHTIFVSNHFSHNGLVPYEEMEKLLPGFVVSYDSLEIEF